MFKKGQVGTEVDKGPFIFTLIVLIGGAAVTVLLFALLTDRAYIDGGKLYMSYLFKRKSVQIEEIGKITYKDDVYTVFDKKNNKVGTLNAKLTSIGEVIFALDKAGVDFE